MDLAPSDEVWNQAAMDNGGPFAKRGDRALASLLRVHGAIMNGGIGHAFDLLDKHDLDLAKDGYIYFGLPQIVRLLTSAEKMDEEMREILGESYSKLIASDSSLTAAFEKRFRSSPDDFAPL
jgi:hypothetical protein